MLRFLASSMRGQAGAPGLHRRVCAFRSSQVRYISLERLLSKHGSRGNIVLMGSPGAGKTSVGSMLASQINRQHIDLDNDHLERVWRCSVAQKLQSVGGDRFVEEEGRATLQLSPDITNTVISLSGSNPMHKEAMCYLKRLGVVVFLDVEMRDILRRLEAMKVNRIVGQTEGIAMEAILKHRQQFYERHYDIRVLIPAGSDVSQCASLVSRTLEQQDDLLAGYISTRCDDESSSMELQEVVRSGLAPDGGLYVPKYSIPTLQTGQWKRLLEYNAVERAVRILEQWLPSSAISPQRLAEIVQTAYSSFEHPGVAPIVNPDITTSTGSRVFLQELFWGPTASFKDMALQITPQIMKHFAKDQEYAMVVATSGDTGSAAMHGFATHTNSPVVVFYPGRGVSQLQQQQMTSLAARFPNCRAVAIDSDFDYCQSAVKKMFSDAAWREHLHGKSQVMLNAANSMNWARLLPQVIHHSCAYLDLVEQGRVEFGDLVDICIPSGNFGNAMAARYAQLMGVPFGRIVIACNENHVLHDFVNTGVYSLVDRPLVRTISPAIDILVSSNVERMLHLTARDLRSPTAVAWSRQAFSTLQADWCMTSPHDIRAAVSKVFSSAMTSQSDCQQCMRDVFTRSGYILDPHTAVAVTAITNKQSAASARVSSPALLVSSTAHWEKFADDVVASIGTSRASLMQSSAYCQHRGLRQALDCFRTEDVLSCPASLNAMKSVVEDTIMSRA